MEIVQKLRQINVLRKNSTINWFDGKKIYVAVNFSFFHSLEITEIYSHVFMAKISWKQHIY